MHNKRLKKNRNFWYSRSEWPQLDVQLSSFAKHGRLAVWFFVKEKQGKLFEYRTEWKQKKVGIALLGLKIQAVYNLTNNKGRWEKH